MSKTYCILGGGGAFGIHTAMYLLDRADPELVVGIGRNPLRPEPFSLRIEDRPRYQYQAFHVGHETDLLLEYLDKLRPDVIINFAAQGEGAASWKHSWRFFDTNATALVRLYEELSARDWFNLHGRRFIQIGTSELYGSVARPALETDPIRPSSPYAASKAAFDLHLLAMSRSGYGAPMNIVRPSNCYCPGQLLHRIIPKAVVCGLTGQKLPLHGGGVAEKSYLHARDLAHAIYLISEKAPSGTMYNVGPGEPISIRHLCEHVVAAINASGAVGGITFADLCEGAAERLCQDSRYWLDSSAIRKDVGWDQTVDLVTGLAEMVEWGRTYIDHLREWPQNYQLRA